MTHRIRRLARPGALAGIAALVLTTTVAVTAAPAQAHPAGDRAVKAAASWLQGQLTDGLLVGQYGADFGLSIDAGLALAEVGEPTAVATIDRALRTQVGSYISGDAFGDAGSTYAGPTAKMATFALVAGADPTSYGGTDLVSRLEGRVSAAAPTVGRIADESSFGDYANVIGQSFAARALGTVGSSRAGDAAGFLLEQQCPEGFFRFGFTADRTATEQGCVSGVDVAHLDTTALAVINLAAAPGASVAETSAMDRATAWLKSQQGADGSWSAGGTEGVNANTTGLAAWALSEAGELGAATKAARWLRGVQVADLAPCATTLTAANGAIAFSGETLAGSRSEGGIADAKLDQYRRATAQALPALSHVPAASAALGISAPTTATERSSVAVTVSGLGLGEPACVSLGTVATPVVGTGTDVALTFDLPAGAATRTFVLTTLEGTRTAATVAAPVVAAPVPVAAATPEAGSLVVPRVVKVRKNRFRVKVACHDDTACEGKIKIRTASKVRLGAKKRARRLTVAKKTYSVAPGDTDRVVLRVRRPARAPLARHRVKVKAVQSAPEADRVVTRFWLRRAR